MRNKRSYKLSVPHEQFVEHLQELTEVVSLEFVWFFRFQFMKRELPFMGRISKDTFDISRLDDLWAYPLRLKGTFNKEINSITITVKPVGTAFLFLTFWALGIIVFSVLVYLQERNIFFVVPLIFLPLPFLIVSFTRKQLIKHFEYTFRNQFA